MTISLTRRNALRAGATVAAAGAALELPLWLESRGASAAELDATTIPQFGTQLYILPAMPVTSASPSVDSYVIAARPFKQQMLPKGFPSTTVFGFGSNEHSSTFHSPSFTIEASVNRRTQVTWDNQLVNSAGKYVSHILPVDPTLHWANPGGGTAHRDSVPSFSKTPGLYKGPVPLVVHMHGAHVHGDSDGFPETWYLPHATNIPKGYATSGSKYAAYAKEAKSRFGATWSAGMAHYEYTNDQRATSLWFHDHTIGMTRLNVRAGLLGLYVLRGGSSDLKAGVLPGPAPRRGEPSGTRHYEIPLVIQDPSFNTDGSQYMPAANTFASGPYIPQTDIPPYWNDVYYGSTITVNGNTWPNLNVEPRRYRFRILNGCAVRPLTLKVVSSLKAATPASSALPMWVIGSDGGFLPKPVEMTGKTGLPVLPAERYDVIVDFTGVKPGTRLYLTNEGSAATAGTTGTVMRFTVGSLKSKDTSTPPQHLKLPRYTAPGTAKTTRRVSFAEIASTFTAGATSSYTCGTVSSSGANTVRGWGDAVTEKIPYGSTETWEVYNFAGTAGISHVFHLHLVQFEVVSRQTIGSSTVTKPHAWESGPKDSCDAPTGTITRVRAHFDRRGTYVWHCHFLDHEDNSMMRPMQVV
ncbi:MAG TPA: multicopper oxidase domain-containing protein [Trebonia sp.]